MLLLWIFLFMLLHSPTSDFSIILRNLSNRNRCLCQDTWILFVVTVSVPLNAEHGPRGRGSFCIVSPAECAPRFLGEGAAMPLFPDCQEMGRLQGEVWAQPWEAACALWLWGSWQPQAGATDTLPRVQGRDAGKQRGTVTLSQGLDRTQMYQKVFRPSMVKFLNNPINVALPTSNFHSCSKISLLWRLSS